MPRLDLLAPACYVFLITREGRKHGDIDWIKIAQTWHMSHKIYILDASPLMHFFPDSSISPARMIPYNSQNNDALIKEIKFALKYVRK
jgi:hypothetical protein